MTKYPTLCKLAGSPSCWSKTAFPETGPSRPTPNSSGKIFLPCKPGSPARDRWSFQFRSGGSSGFALAMPSTPASKAGRSSLLPVIRGPLVVPSNATQLRASRSSVPDLPLRSLPAGRLRIFCQICREISIGCERAGRVGVSRTPISRTRRPLGGQSRQGTDL